MQIKMKHGINKKCLRCALGNSSKSPNVPKPDRFVGLVCCTHYFLHAIRPIIRTPGHNRFRSLQIVTSAQVDAFHLDAVVIEHAIRKSKFVLCIVLAAISPNLIGARELLRTQDFSELLAQECYRTIIRSRNFTLLARPLFSKSPFFHSCIVCPQTRFYRRYLLGAFVVVRRPRPELISLWTGLRADRALDG